MILEISSIYENLACWILLKYVFCGKGYNFFFSIFVGMFYRNMSKEWRGRCIIMYLPKQNCIVFAIWKAKVINMNQKVSVLCTRNGYVSKTLWEKLINQHVIMKLQNVILSMIYYELTVNNQAVQFKDVIGLPRPEAQPTWEKQRHKIGMAWHNIVAA